MNCISLNEAILLFEKYKLDTYPDSHSSYDFSMIDCLNRNHIVRRLPLYILDEGKYIETRKNIIKYKDFTNILFVNKDHLKRFFEKELSPKWDYGYCEYNNEDKEEYKQSEVTKSLRARLKSVIGKIHNYDDTWTELFKEWRDESRILSVEMKYLGDE